MPKAWVIRAGKYGERDSWALQNGCSGGGWYEVPDLTPCTTREQVGSVVAESFPGAKEGKFSNFTGQLWGLRSCRPARTYSPAPSGAAWRGSSTSRATADPLEVARWADRELPEETVARGVRAVILSRPHGAKTGDRGQQR